MTVGDIIYMYVATEDINLKPQTFECNPQHLFIIQTIFWAGIIHHAKEEADVFNSISE